GRAGRNPDRHFLPVDRPNVDLRAERGLSDVDRHRRDHVQPFAPEEPIRLDLEGDDQIARRAVAIAAAALPFETDLRPGVHAGRHGDHHLFPNAHLARSTARGAALARYSSLAQTHRARTLNGESTLAERDRSAA